MHAAAAAAKSLQSCLTLCDPIDGSPPGSPVPGILQARTLEWVVISFSNAWKWKNKAKSLSRVRLLATPWTVAHQAPPSMGFSRREYWSGVPLPSPVGCILQYFFNELFSSYSSLFFCASNPSSPNLFSYHYVFSCNNLPTDVPITTILTEFTSLLTLSAKAYFSSWHLAFDHSFSE